MISYKQDPDVVWWGLHLLEGDPYSSSGYCGNVTQNDIAYYDGHYGREAHYYGTERNNILNNVYGTERNNIENNVMPGTERNNIENDEMIAHTLQEEFSQLAVAESSENSVAGQDHMQASILAQDWLGPSGRNYNTGIESGFNEGDDVQASSSRANPEENSYNEEEWPGSRSSPGENYYNEEWPGSLELMDESGLDGEVGKRLNHMVSIPHIPKINGEIPTIDEATSDHQRLLDRLQLYDLVELKMQGDGNCQFRALSDQFYRTSEHHKFVRQQICEQLKSHPEYYEEYVPMPYDDYMKKMSRSGEWGDHVTLQAAADSYGVKIFVITSFKDTCYIEILPNNQKSERDIPTFETYKKKKKWWKFGNKH